MEEELYYPWYSKNAPPKLENTSTESPSFAKEIENRSQAQYFHRVRIENTKYIKNSRYLGASIGTILGTTAPFLIAYLSNSLPSQIIDEFYLLTAIDSIAGLGLGAIFGSLYAKLNLLDRRDHSKNILKSLPQLKDQGTLERMVE